MNANLISKSPTPNAKTTKEPRPGLLEPTAPDDRLTVGDGARILCTGMVTGPNRMMVAACGQEQTRIIYGFADILARYEGLNINSVCTNRSEGSAGSFLILSDVYGDTNRLRAFARDLLAAPWFEPCGRSVQPETIMNLKIIAPDRRKLLRDALGIISAEHGVNIETMVNRTYQNMYDDGFDCLFQQRTGPTAGVNEEEGGPGDGATGTGGTGGTEREETRSARKTGWATGEGTGGGNRSGGWGWGIGADVEGTGRGTPMAGVRGGGDGRDYEHTGRISVTHMRLEIPTGVNLERLKRDLGMLGKDWEFRWEERIGGTRHDGSILKRILGDLVN